MASTVNSVPDDPARKIQVLERRVGRERRARAQAEEISERALRDLFARNTYLELLLQLARLSGVSGAGEDAEEILLRQALGLMLKFGNADVAHLWNYDAKLDALVSSGIWYQREGLDVESFHRITTKMVFHRDEGLPGRVLSTKEPLVIQELNKDSNFPRIQAAAQCALNFAIGLPVLEGDEVVSVIEFLSNEAPSNAQEYSQQLQEATGQVATIIARHRASRAMSEAREAAEDAVRMQREFLGMISHEMRTPLNGVIGLVQVLQNSSLDAQQSRYLDLIFSSAERLQGVITSMLDYARRDRAKSEVASAPFGLLSLAKELIEKFRPDAEGRGLQISLETSGDIPQVVLGDEQRVRKICEALIDNAVKFTSSGSVNVRVVGTQPEAEAAMIAFEIQDTGPGIAEESISKVFEPFVQLDASRSRSHGGTGLGLALARKLAATLEGRVELANAPSGGLLATFKARFPIAIGAVAGGIDNRGVNGAGPADSGDA